MKSYTLVLPSFDVFQVLDALDDRAESWEYTAMYLNGHLNQGDDFRELEECHNPNEAADIAKHFRDIGEKIREQIGAQ